jgi:GTPase SAR1 family protein
MFSLVQRFAAYLKSSSCKGAPPTEVSLLFAGLDNAGKSTCIASLVKGQCIFVMCLHVPRIPLTQTLARSPTLLIALTLLSEDWQLVAPSIGFSNSNVIRWGYAIHAIDVGGGVRIRDIWVNYYAEVSIRFIQTLPFPSPMLVCCIRSLLLILFILGGVDLGTWHRVRC